MQFERLKAAASHGSESSRSDGRPAGRRSQDSRRSGGRAGTGSSSRQAPGHRGEPGSPRSSFGAALRDRLGALHLRGGSTSETSSASGRLSSNGSGAWSSGDGEARPGARSGGHPAAAAAGHGLPSAAERLAAAAQTNSTMRSSGGFHVILLLISVNPIGTCKRSRLYPASPSGHLVQALFDNSSQLKRVTGAK